MYKRTYTTDWDFRSSNTKEYTHTYHTYPAMMIPQIARKLIKNYQPTTGTNLIFDPYMGSGTTLVEAQLQGIKSIGTDLNPLARLMAKAKTTSFDYEKIIATSASLKEKIKCYEPSQSLNFDHITNVDFWYSKDALAELHFLHMLIKALPLSIQDFYLVALSECIREVSYTRNGEFKRYRMAKEKIPLFKPATFQLFFNKVTRNTKGLFEFINQKSNAITEIYAFNTVHHIPKKIIDNQMVDMVVTSPPYGDSKTTVAYGQFSRWANEWFRFDKAKIIDKLLMGGKKVSSIHFATTSIKEELAQIKSIDEKRYQEVCYFLDDYFRSICNVSKTIRLGGRVCYVVGNRTVKGVQIPLDYFTIETFERNGFQHLDTFVRNIPNKRMPSKNSPTNKKGKKSSTMTAEYIIIMEKIN